MWWEWDAVTFLLFFNEDFVFKYAQMSEKCIFVLVFMEVKFSSLTSKTDKQLCSVTILKSISGKALFGSVQWPFLTHCAEHWDEVFSK